jgi:transcriptional regulator NrdR family protein
MNCPACGHGTTRVLNTRHDTAESIIRQRICQGCAHYFHTVEVDLKPGSVYWTGKTMARHDGAKHIKIS